MNASFKSSSLVAPGHPHPLIATMTEDQWALCNQDVQFLCGYAGTYGMQVTIPGSPSRVWKLRSEAGEGKHVYIQELGLGEREFSKAELIEAGRQTCVRGAEWTDEDKVYIRIARALLRLG